MQLNVNRNVVQAVAITGLLTSLFFVFGLPRLQRAKEPTCHDAIYVFPLEPGDDDFSRSGLPSRKMQFVCPHSEQKLEFIGQGGFTCKCDSYLRNK